MSTPVISAEGLRKRYGKTYAVRGVNLSINEGEVFGLLGPNGSGKTTTILMLLGLTEPTDGKVTVAGCDPLREPLEVKRRVGYLPDMVGFYDNMTARENLSYSARLMNIPRDEAMQRIDAALERVGLGFAANRKVAGFSHGMKQRLGIAELLLKQARVLILDEPTNGLDPQATQELLKLIGTLRGEGLTVVISSHMLGLVQSICDRVALFRSGRVGLVGKVDELARQVLGSAYAVEIDAEDVDVAEALLGLEGLTAVTRLPNGQWRAEADRDLRSAIANRIVKNGGQLKEVRLNRASLDDVYARYFARQEKDEEVKDAA
jgi:ABC-2 type transport system ATP-binding protein